MHCLLELPGIQGIILFAIWIMQFIRASVRRVMKVKVCKFLGCCDALKKASAFPLDSRPSASDFLSLLMPVRSFWPISLSHRRFTYSSKFSDVDLIQLSELWERTMKVSRHPKKIMKALYHSFTFVLVLAQDDASIDIQASKRIVGVGRAVWDGAFVATICDVAVDPKFQRHGIGRRIVKYLVQDVKKKGCPSGFAVFPPPSTRGFFWVLGFRSERKYRFMLYKGV